MTAPVEPMTAEERALRHLHAAQVSDGGHGLGALLATIDALRAEVAAQAKVIEAADAMRLGRDPCNARLRGDDCLVQMCADTIAYDAARAALVKP